MKRFIALLFIVMLLGAGCISLAPNVVVFSANPTVITAGGSTTLTWDVSGANSVTIDQGLGELPPTGSQTVSPSATTVYTLKASNAAGSVSASVVVTVNPMPIVIDFGVNPPVINSGTSAALIWDVSGASSAVIDQGIGTVPLSGSQVVTPSVTTTYTLTATGPAGTESRSVVLSVNPPINATFTISPSVIGVGQSATLQWNVTGAESVSVDQGIGEVPLAGTRVVSPYYTTTYTLTASSSCCSVTKAAVLTVGGYYPYELPFGYPNGFPYGFPYGYPYTEYRYPLRGPVIDIFSVSPSTISAGGSATLQWYVTNATSVYITGIGSVGLSGTIAVSPLGTTTYSLTANNFFGAASRSVTVTVQ